jgi:nickel transport protein
MPPALLLALSGFLVTAGDARAHRLEAEYRVLPGQRVQIESWFDLTGESPKGAKVQVFRPDGQLLSEGQLNDKGLFVFSYSQPERLKVIVSAGAGHRKELEIPQSALATSSKTSPSENSTASDSDATSPADVPFADRSPRTSLKDVVAGVGFLLALAAFVLSLRNARQLKAIMGKRN